MKKIIALVLVLMMSLSCIQGALACTILAAGKDATVDGATIVSQTDDSSVADFRLWAIPSMKGGEGITRDLVLDSHNYGDYGDYPNTKDYGNGMLVAEIPQPEDTNRYFHSRYSFINDAGVAMGESTFSISTATEYGKKVKELVYGGFDGLIDCWNAQDIALEQADSAREAVEVMGALVEEHLWSQSGETINIGDGDEVWIMEIYGRDLWAAFRLPDDALFVGANRARINTFDFEDKENFLCSANLKSFAVDNGLWKEEDGNFSPADIYAPNDSAYAFRREWRGMDLVAPSLGLDPELADQALQPLYVVPDKKVSVDDIFKIHGDYYQGTPYDQSLTMYSGDFGDPLNIKNPERTINLFRTCYNMIASINDKYADEVKSLVWYGYGAADSGFIMPLWPSMTSLPKLFTTGNRYENFDRESGWWIASYVQQVAKTNYNYAIDIIHDRRADRMAKQYEEVPVFQELISNMIKDGQSELAIDLLTGYASNNAEEWFDIWLELGDELFADTMFGNAIEMKYVQYSDWYQEVLDNTASKPVEQDAPKE